MAVSPKHIINEKSACINLANMKNHFLIGALLKKEKDCIIIEKPPKAIIIEIKETESGDMLAERAFEPFVISIMPDIIPRAKSGFIWSLANKTLKG